MTDFLSFRATVIGLVNAARGQAVKTNAPMTRLQVSRLCLVSDLSTTKGIRNRTIAKRFTIYEGR